jgi:hypothetical protein
VYMTHSADRTLLVTPVGGPLSIILSVVSSGHIREKNFLRPEFCIFYSLSGCYEVTRTDSIIDLPSI